MRCRLARTAIGGLVLLLLACSAPTTPAASRAAPEPAGPGAASTSAPAAAAQPAAPPARAKFEYMMIVPIVNYWHQYVAQEKGLFEAQNLEVEFSYADNSSKVVQALASGSVPLGGPSPDAVINAVEHGSNLVLVAGEVNKMAYSLVASRDVRSYADLRGKTLAVIGLQEGSTVVLKKMLGDHGLRPDDYSLVPVGGTANRAAAVSNGTTAAAMIGQPQDFRLTAEGFTNLGNSYDVFPYYPSRRHHYPPRLGAAKRRRARPLPARDRAGRPLDLRSRQPRRRGDRGRQRAEDELRRGAAQLRPADHANAGHPAAMATSRWKACKPSSTRWSTSTCSAHGTGAREVRRPDLPRARAALVLSQGGGLGVSNPQNSFTPGGCGWPKPEKVA